MINTVSFLITGLTGASNKVSRPSPFRQNGLYWSYSTAYLSSPRENICLTSSTFSGFSRFTKVNFLLSIASASVILTNHCPSGLFARFLSADTGTNATIFLSFPSFLMPNTLPFKVARPPSSVSYLAVHALDTLFTKEMFT